MQTSYAVLDAGILLATVQAESYTQHAKALIRGLAERSVKIAAPTLLRYEVVAVVRKWVYRELTTPRNAQRALDMLLEYPIELYFDEALLKRGYELATDYDRPTAYDAQYLALAERLACDFWTADKRLFNAVKDRFPNIDWLGNVDISGR
jgi:predicted nucleic acid-binding protein